MSVVNEEINDLPGDATEDAGQPSDPTPQRRSPWLVWTFAATIFLSAFLLFQVQPLISKAILPWFGGTPNVWTTAMLFFQTLLFAGYAYAHFTTERLGPRAQGVVHCTLAGIALVLLPILPAASWKPNGDADPTIGILLLLLAHVGLPYFLLASTSPLIQVWWNRSSTSGSPYRLYSLSNLGSLLALLSYPFFFEPMLATSFQGLGWSVAFVVFVALVISCGSVFWWKRRAAGLPVSHVGPGPERDWQSNSAGGVSAEAGRSAADEEITSVQRLLWIGLAATGSLLLLATTNHICHDIAVVPLLWIAPLSLYLLTFILCFAGRGYPRWVFLISMMATTGYIVLDQTGAIGWLNKKLGLKLIEITGVADNYLAALAVYLLAMFSCCMVCHGELWRLKPAPAKLTSFYLYVSFGGALGGIFVGIGGPLLLTGYYEMSIGIILCWFFALAVLFLDRQGVMYNGRPLWAWSMVAACFCGLVGGLAGNTFDSSPGRVARSRNFYGVLTVTRHESKSIEDHRLTMVNGLILHGLQYLENDRRYWATTYYTDVSGVGLAMNYTSERPERQIGVVGLGTGSMAAHAQAGDYMRFYEINPVVRDFAREYFTYIQDAEADNAVCEVVLGDARISLERELEAGDPQRFDVLVLDAFSSDAIPAHLLTREAIQLYLRHLRDESDRQGILVVHISNRYLDLFPITQALADEFDLDIAQVDTESDDDTTAFAAHWVLMARRGGLDEIVQGEDYVSLEDRDDNSEPVLWTDDYTNIFRVLDLD